MSRLSKSAQLHSGKYLNTARIQNIGRIECSSIEWRQMANTKSAQMKELDW